MARPPQPRGTTTHRDAVQRPLVAPHRTAVVPHRGCETRGEDHPPWSAILQGPGEENAPLSDRCDWVKQFFAISSKGSVLDRKLAAVAFGEARQNQKSGEDRPPRSAILHQCEWSGLRRGASGRNGDDAGQVNRVLGDVELLNNRRRTVTLDSTTTSLFHGKRSRRCRPRARTPSTILVQRERRTPADGRRIPHLYAAHAPGVLGGATCSTWAVTSALSASRRAERAGVVHISTEMRAPGQPDTGGLAGRRVG